MAKIMTKQQRSAAKRRKALKIAVPSLLAVLLVFGVVFAAVNFFGNKGNDEAPKQEALDALSDGTDEPEDDLRVFFSDEYKENAYGIRKKQDIPISMFPENYNERKHLSGNDEAVSIPLAMNQQRIDTLKRSMSGTALNEALDELYKENQKELEGLPLAEQKEFLLEQLATELLDAAYGDMWVQTFRESWPEVIEQNPLLGEFEEWVKEALNRKPEDGKPVGWSAFMKYEDAAAKAAEDHSRMVMCDKTDEEAGTYNYYDVYCLINEIFKQLLTYEGIQTLESTDNWCLPLTVDFDTMRTKKSDEQEDLPAAVWAHRTKMGTITAKYGINTTDRRSETYEKKETPRPEDQTPTDNPDPGDDPDPNGDPDKYPAQLVHYDVQTGDTLATDNLGSYVVGATVTGSSKSIPNYTALKSSVSGMMTTSGLTLKIPYKKNGTDPKVYSAKLIHYDKDTGKTLGTDNLGDYAVGAKVTGNARAFAGYTADVSSVSDTMKEGGLTLKIPYTKDVSDPEKYPATLIHYDMETNETLATDSLGDFEVNATVTGNAKSFAGYTVATAAPVSDTMKKGGLTLRIGYKKSTPPPVEKEYPATLVHYDKESGATLGTDNLGNYKVGANVTGNAKSFTGYTADMSSVSGTMVEGGLTLKIPYTPKHDGDGGKDPEADPENKPGYNPGIGDNEEGGTGEEQEEKPGTTDHENGGDQKPEDNQNNDGSDQTKPATPPITEDADDITVEDENGNQSEVKDEPENTGKVSDDDPVQYGGAAVEAAPAVQAEAPKEEPKKEVAVEVEAVEPAPAVEKAVPAEEKKEEVVETKDTSSEDDGAGDYQEEQP